MLFWLTNFQKKSSLFGGERWDRGIWAALIITFHILPYSYEPKLLSLLLTLKVALGFGLMLKMLPN